MSEEDKPVFYIVVVPYVCLVGLMLFSAIFKPLQLLVWFIVALITAICAIGPMILKI